MTIKTVSDKKYQRLLAKAHRLNCTDIGLLEALDEARVWARSRELKDDANIPVENGKLS